MSAPVFSQRDEFESTRETILQGLEQIMSDPKSINQRLYISLYEAVHIYCFRRNPAFRYAEESRKDLYDRLDDYLRRRVEIIRATVTNLVGDDDALLRLYAEEWSRYNEASRLNDRIFASLHRHWIVREIAEGHNVLELVPLHMQRWKEGMFETVKDNEIVSALLRITEKPSTNPEVVAMGQAVNTTIASMTAVDVDLDEDTRSRLVEFAV